MKAARRPAAESAVEVRPLARYDEILAQLVPEPDNRFDSSAVAVNVDRRRVGYLSRDDAARAHAKLRELLDNHDALLVRAFLRGGRTDDGDLRFGVTIDVPNTGTKFGW